MLEQKILLEEWLKEEKFDFSGWDFSHLNGRVLVEAPPWDYPKMAKEFLSGSRSALDIATGGGEILSSLAPFHGQVTAIEGYAPNLPIAESKLKPLGVAVLAAPDAGPFPFPDSAFDLVLNRHGGCWSPEIARVCSPGAHFLTQQVGGDTLSNLMSEFSRKPKWPENTLSFVCEKLKSFGFEILRGEEWTGKSRFRDVGAIVYTLKATPWLVSNFSVETHLEVLLKLQKRLELEGKLEFNSSSFLIQARKH